MEYSEPMAKPRDSRTMEERLRSSYTDAIESLGLLRETLKAGGVLQETPGDENVRAMNPQRTPLEGAVSSLEDLGWMIRELNNQVVI